MVRLKLPPNFKDFLRDSKNEVELFKFLTHRISNCEQFMQSKTKLNNIVIIGSSVVCNGLCQLITQLSRGSRYQNVCSSLEKGARKIYICTVDTDMTVFIAGIFFQLQSMYADLNIWVAFGMGKIFQYFHIYVNALSSKK